MEIEHDPNYIQEMVIVSPALGSTVVKTEKDGWLDRTTWSDGTISWSFKLDPDTLVSQEPCGEWIKYTYADNTIVMRRK
jgi:hypothetical protein